MALNIADLAEHAIDAVPDRVALICGDDQLTYAQLEEKANRLAHYLIDQGVPAGSVIAVPEGHTSFESLQAAASTMREHELESAFLVSDPWHNARIERMASDLGIVGHASATWTSAAKTEETRVPGYIRETFAYLAYRILGH